MTRYCECNKCGMRTVEYAEDDWLYNLGRDFCPNCQKKLSELKKDLDAQYQKGIDKWLGGK